MYIIPCPAISKLRLGSVFSKILYLLLPHLILFTIRRSALTVADVSTPLSRASTFSPLMSAFAAGMALGPAVGGMLHDLWGIRDTFFMVGMLYGVAACWNHVSVNETMSGGELWEKDVLPWHESAVSQGTTVVGDGSSYRNEGKGTAKSKNSSNAYTTIPQAVRDTTEQWRDLLSDRITRPIVIMNGFYMLALSGTQFTLLPLFLTGGSAAAGLALTASTVGQLYMWMSAVQVLGNPVAGRIADRAGKAPAIVVGGILTSVAMASVPAICASGMTSVDVVDWPLLAGTLGVWSLGGTLLSTSHVSDRVCNDKCCLSISLTSDITINQRWQLSLIQ